MRDFFLTELILILWNTLHGKFCAEFDNTKLVTNTKNMPRVIILKFCVGANARFNFEEKMLINVLRDDEL